MKITIYNDQGAPAQTIPTPEEPRQARHLWAFLVANLQPGFRVQLLDDTGQITRPSGEKLPTHLFERLLGGGRLDQLGQ